MGALEVIRDFVNTADFEAGKEELADPVSREVREAIRTLLRANNGLPADVAGASLALSRVAESVGLRVGFEDGGLVFESTERILAVLAEALADESWSRLKACASETCQYAFIDTARNRSRRWCDMAICGNREKARRFRSRHG